MKHPYNRVLAAMLAAALLLAGCAGNANNGSSLPEFQESSQAAEDSAAPGVLKAAYDESDALNPYTTKSLQNYVLCSLLYDPLVKLDPSYQTQNYLAQGIEKNGLEYTVQLRPNIKFWDGSALTAADVAYSLSLAMQSGYYAAGLSHVESVTEDPDDPLVLHLVLSREDAFFENSLTFPVIQNGGGDRSRPVGSGRFRPGAGSHTLVPNPGHWEQVENFSSIELVEVADIDALSYSIKIGTIDYMFSDLRGSWNKSLGNGYSSVQLSNLVYLGANNGRGLMVNAELRSLLSDAIDREALGDKVYMGFATPARLPFNPAASAVPYLTPSPGKGSPGERLDALGYAGRDENGYRTDTYGRRMTLSILVNSENSYRMELARVIAQTCEALGIQVTLDERPFSEYQQVLLDGGYDLYIAEVKLPYNMDMQSIIGNATLASSGIYVGEELRSALETCLATGEGFETAAELFEGQTPFIPLFYRRGIVAYALNFSSNIVATEQDIFYNIHQWKLS